MTLQKMMLFIPLLRQVYLFCLCASVGALSKSIFYENYTADIYKLANISIAMACLLLSINGYVKLKTRFYVLLREQMYEEDKE